jgi:hypothetical protein
MNEKQRKALDGQIRKGCRKCGKKATVLVIWSFEDTTKPTVTEHPILAFVCCDDHVEAVRVQQPQAPPHIFVRITEESLKPLIFQ